ncbi:MAG: S41 family peptidase [Bacteroidia bacterium]|nr:S41 family peptidase [Bacteroidia bacterium]
MNKRYVFYPVIGALLVVGGMYVGIRLGTNRTINQAQSFFSSRAAAGNKLNNVINYIQAEYVDTVNADQLSNQAINNLLAELDPHSVYIPAEEFEHTNEQLDGGFDGIGVEFNILNDTLMVVSPLNGGPSATAGVMPGDKIINVNGKCIAGIGIKSDDVFKYLKGKKGTLVKLDIQRASFRKLLPFNITRDKIPLKSVDVSFIISPTVGFIKISKFSATTHTEFTKAFIALKAQGLQSLILDLRGNPGGFLNEAVDLCDDFLEDKKLIVYTQGKARPKQQYFATNKGVFEKGKLVVLIDEGSASAAEIVAGAIQDNDRGSVIGRRSFGKGLVQEQNQLADGSGIRLTIARYYTPSGRCIQKPYTKGKLKDYYEEEVNRYKNGELLNKDSVKFNTKETFKTLKGRTVYGGGGVMPDEFVGIDTSTIQKEMVEILIKTEPNKYCLTYANAHRKQLTALKQEPTLNLAAEFLQQNNVNVKHNQVTQLINDYLLATTLRYSGNEILFYKLFYKKDKIAKTGINTIVKGNLQ